MSMNYPGSHFRDNIRQAVVDLIKNLNTAAVDRVFGNRRPFLNCGEFPSIRVSTPLERVKTVLSDNPLILLRELTVSIEIKIKSSNTSQDDLDQIGRDVEFVMTEDEGLGYGCSLTFNLAEPVFFSIGRHCFDGLQLEYRCDYETESPDFKNLNEFRTAYAEWIAKVGSNNPEDRVIFPINTGFIHDKTY